MTKVAIIGCGYVGMPMAKLWRDRGFTVTATTTRAERIPELQTVSDRAIVCHSRDRDTLKRVFHDQETVLVSVAPGQGGDYQATYLETARAIAAIVPNFPQLRQIIYTSTYSVYGDHQGAWVTEETPLKPVTPKQEIVATTEHVWQAITGISVCILRLGGIYGPGRTLEKIFSRWAGQTRPGSGENWSNWVHLMDIVGAIAFAQEHQLTGIYNLVQDEILTFKDLIARVCDRAQLAPVAWDASQPSPRPYNVRCSNQKLKTAGYVFEHPRFFASEKGH